MRSSCATLRLARAAVLTLILPCCDALRVGGARRRVGQLTRDDFEVPSPLRPRP